MSYANKTSVSIDRSQAEIRKILSKYRATGFAFAEQSGTAVVMFEMCNRRIKFVLPMPITPSDSATQITWKKYDQLCRTRWRCLVLSIKAKLESIESGITSFEQEFLAHIVLPSGRTMGETSIPQIAQSYEDGKMPPLLGYGP